MIVWRLILVLAVAELVQGSFLAAWRPGGIVPSLVLGLVVAAVLRGQARPVTIAAALTGLALDLNSGAYSWLWTLILPSTAIVSKLVQRSGLVGHDFSIGFGMVLATTVLAGTVTIVGMAPWLTAWPVGLLAGRLTVEVAINEIIFCSMWFLAAWLVRPQDTLPGVRRV